MKRTELNIGLTSYDDIFKSDESRNTEEIKRISISDLKPFEENPYKVRMDNSMDELVESISTYGVLSPIIARPHKDGGYEIISGHRRAKACELAGIENVSIILKNLDDYSAIILLVDSNIHRENVLPSEKAYAYQMKLEAMKRKAGRPSKENYVQIEHNLGGKTSREELSKEIGESPAQVQRYIRLTNLIDPISENKYRQEIFDIIIEEACRQWCDFIDESPERKTGKGFADFFFQIFQDKEIEYIKAMDLAFVEQNYEKIDCDKFFKTTNGFTEMYYNPDATAGGQIVELTIYNDDIVDAAKLHKNPKEFFAYLESVSKGALYDVGTATFRETAQSLIDSKADFEGINKQSMHGLMKAAGIKPPNKDMER